jgi:hypothetical protein
MNRGGRAFVVATVFAALAANRASAELLTVATMPDGLTVTVDSTNYTAPAIFDWAEGSLHTLDTPSPQVAGDGHSRASFAGWSDGGDTNSPLGPWYDAGQLVSLTTKTNTGYRIYFWQGVDSATGITAQITMNGYHLVQASFIPSDYPYIVVTNNGGAAPGDLIGSLGGRTADHTALYYVVLDNTGTNALLAGKTSTLARFVTPQGFDAVPGGGAFSL